MSMHLEGPWLSTTGKKKGKKKFASAEHARKAREQAEAWEALQKKWASPTKTTNRKSDLAKSPVVTKAFVRDTGPRIESLPFTAGPCTKPEQKVYTGDKIKGIGTMHKSNAVPIFSDEEAIDIAKMRR